MRPQGNSLGSSLNLSVLSPHTFEWDMAAIPPPCTESGPAGDGRSLMNGTHTRMPHSRPLAPMCWRIDARTRTCASGAARCHRTALHCTAPLHHCTTDPHHYTHHRTTIPRHCCSITDACIAACTAAFMERVLAPFTRRQCSIEAPWVQGMRNVHHHACPPRATQIMAGGRW